MDRGDLEQRAIALYETHNLDAERPATTVKLARLELGEDAIVRAPLTVSGPAVLFWQDGKQRIGVRKNLPREYALFFIGHELAHALLEREGYHEADLEAACDYLSAAMGAPRPAVRRMHRFAGFDLEVLAQGMRTTQTGAVLRVAEVHDAPLAAVSPRLVRTRGPDEFVWPGDAEIRRWARGERPGIRKVPITDGRGRLALVASRED